jgi:hypothetical protein
MYVSIYVCICACMYEYIRTYVLHMYICVSINIVGEKSWDVCMHAGRTHIHISAYRSHTATHLAASYLPLIQPHIFIFFSPSVLGQPFLRFYLMAEHRGCRESANILENTRTTQTNWFIRQMAWQVYKKKSKKQSKRKK